MRQGVGMRALSLAIMACICALMVQVALARVPKVPIREKKRFNQALVAAKDDDKMATTMTSMTAESDEHEEEDKGPVVRCRMCGAKVALKQDHMELHDTSKAVSSRPESVLGDKGEVYTFVNPSRVEMELVAFKKAVGVEAEAFTSQATFFEHYNWRDLRCSGCNRHLGWKFHHDDLEQCIHSSMMHEAADRAEQARKASSVMELAKNKEIVRQALEGQCVTASAGWWTYQVCYQKDVRQYHEEADGTRPSDWSMGVYRADDGSMSEMPTTTSTDVVQYYTGGQPCDENGVLRNSKVVYTCCKTNPATATIENVEEPSLCSYVITVCVPTLCDQQKQQTSYEYSKIVDTCEAEFVAKQQQQQQQPPTTPIPPSFAALRWSTVISEDSSELDWMRNLQLA